MLVLRYKKCYLCTKKTKNNTIYEEVEGYTRGECGVRNKGG